ncbi:hypothetical protein DMH01_33055 [Amycolatopsis sp. WAC 04182]|uniref:hypothetical protein n=1 Tax=Amycolatopsis sp. WAC 04182 TaxID=2203198 RepID=UPI000F792B61|nr:hypothetical protein [Amycolatopsis sp. WAC 04182]RSN55152.1 hypothetical protein DMH01_33055 [Amycolatopsis sp. WAC 04182]
MPDANGPTARGSRFPGGLVAEPVIGGDHRREPRKVSGIVDHSPATFLVRHQVMYRFSQYL